MTAVRIIVDDQLLGNVEIEQDDRVTTWHEDRQRAAINRLLNEATIKIRAAYRLDEQDRDR